MNHFINHNGMKLEVTYRKAKKIKMNMLRLNNMLLEDQWINDEIKEEMRNTSRQTKIKIQFYKIYRMQQE